MESLLYTAELTEEDGTFTVIVRDFVNDTVQTVEVSRRAVEKLPVLLAALTSKQKIRF
ncbi:hypothetical protein [Kitasatospora aureofaciens]|uniref:hypothetical protein n=1 Tax=Kitasatospora aureofaciens TaxID=1894 RepID=UPI001C43AD19|nr:hypothetical protein [Kitasatospora aureofaciens]MBV6697680.1 hypothetical protein [Kitasatospora aureofaciens]